MNYGAHANCSKHKKEPRFHNHPLPLAMYSSFRQFCEQVLRIPHDPTPPPGDERSTRIFRAAPNYYKYRLIVWGFRTGLLLLVLVGAVLVPTIIASLAAHN